MPRINLLPWREAERKKRQQDFMVALGGAVMAAVAVIGLTWFMFEQMIDGLGRQFYSQQFSVQWQPREQEDGSRLGLVVRSDLD